MILVSVGTQLPFDRLIQIVDEISATLDEKVFAQTGIGIFQPKNITWQSSVPAVEFDALLASARVLVTHAGIGSVLKAYQYSKPIILMPRRVQFGEHRNDHQLATTAKLAGRQGIYVANNATDLAEFLSRQSLLKPNNSELVGRINLQTHISRVVAEVLQGPSIF